MAITSGGVSIPVGADLTGFEKGLKQAEKLANKTAAGIKKFALGKVWDTSSFISGMKMSNKEFDKFILKTEQAKEKYRDLLQLSDGLKQSDMWSQIGDEARKAVSDAVASAKQEADAYDRTLKHMGRGQRIKGLFEGFKKGFSKIAALFTGFRHKTAQAGSDFSRFLGRLVGIGSVALLVRKAYQMMRDGLSNLIKADARTASSVNQLKAALASLRNSLGAIAAPIVNAVAPALIKIISLFTRAANAVAHFMAAITGQKSVVIATEGVSSGVSGIGDAASGANDKAKELQRTLMGFDKINKLDKDDKDSGSGGGGGGGGAGGGGMGFTTVPVSGFAEDWAEKFRKSWEDADFYWLGELLANKLNHALANIPWDKIHEGARTLGKSLATFLNGFIENTDWELVGATIANGLNTAVYFAQEFVHNFNWSALGKAVADTINGFFKTTDWSAIGDTIGTALKGALETLTTAVKNVDWAQIGRSVVTMLASIDWVGLIKGSIELIGSIQKAIFDLLKGAILEAKERLVNWIKTGKIWDDLFTLGDTSLKLSVDTGKNALDFVANLVGWDKDKSWSDNIGGMIANFTNKVISFLPETVQGWIAKFTGKSYDGGTSTISGWTAKFTKKVVDVAAGTLSGFTAKITKITKKLKKSAYNLGGGFTAVVTSIINKAKKKLTGFLSKDNASGGVYKNGRWSPIQRYAEGGLPNGSQLFWAREAGPELVGTLGSHTAVMNNDQIVASVSSGVAKAISGVQLKMSAMPKIVVESSSSTQPEQQPTVDNTEVVNLLRVLIDEIRKKDFSVSLDGRQIGNTAVSYINDETRRTGMTPIMI